jgi:hypothetical protein
MATVRKAQDKVRDEIVRLWGDLPVVDSTADLRIIITPEDVRRATRKDPSCCVFAQAAKRQLGSTKVLFYRNVAYVDMPDEQGHRRVERYVMPKSMRGLVEAFDRGQVNIPPGGFLLKAPSPSQTLSGHLVYQRRHQHRRKLAGQRLLPLRQQHAACERSVTVDLSVRSGTGYVHFSRR